MSSANACREQWVLCPFCGGKTITRLREDTVPENFPLFCPKCRKETIVNARKGIVTTLFAI